jgi:maleylpyruvate isomerase
VTAYAGDPMVEQVQIQTAAVFAAVRALDDAALRAPSALPGWSRGHVVAHLARNGDGFANVATSGVTGVLTPMYATTEQRDADIEAGAGGSPDQLAQDLQASSERLWALLGQVPDTAVDLEVPSGRGGTMRVGDLPWLRVRELVYHHVDLAVGYGFADAPAAVVRAGLLECEQRSAVWTPSAPRVLARCPDAEGGPLALELGPTPGPDDHRSPDAAPVVVDGSAPDLLTWLTGRGPGSGLRTEHDVPLPALPSWG